MSDPRPAVLPATTSPELAARITTTSDGMRTCTLFPTSASDPEQTSAWITASEGSYVDFAELR